MKLGAKGEDIAAKWFQRKGFRIERKNFRTKIGEIDLVISRGNMLIFCEVKTRKKKEFAEPFESVTKRKIDTIKKVAEIYLLKNKAKENEIRFDVVSLVEKGKGKFEINHIENAF